MTLRAKAHEVLCVAICLAYPLLVIAGIAALIGLVPAVQRLSLNYP